MDSALAEGALRVGALETHTFRHLLFRLITIGLPGALSSSGEGTAGKSSGPASCDPNEIVE